MGRPFWLFVVPGGEFAVCFLVPYVDVFRPGTQLRGRQILNVSDGISNGPIGRRHGPQASYDPQLPVFSDSNLPYSVPPAFHIRTCWFHTQRGPPANSSSSKNDALISDDDLRPASYDRPNRVLIARHNSEYSS
jgi:hypothetical protein